MLKAGGGLFVHNIMHQTTKSSNSPLQDNQKDKEIGYSCSCIDDFMMPFTETDQPVFLSPVTVLLSFTTSPSEDIRYSDSILSLLRGPPALLA
jgi:hypothetical protein